MSAPLDGAERRFAGAAVRRIRLFLVLAVAGVAVGVGLACYYGYRRALDPGYPLAPRIVLVVLILLNARLNLRQFRYACLLDKLLQSQVFPDQKSRPPEPAPRERDD